MSLIPPPHADRQASACDEDVAQHAFWVLDEIAKGLCDSYIIGHAKEDEKG
jgi:hypothetical protein